MRRSAEARRLAWYTAVWLIRSGMNQTVTVRKYKEDFAVQLKSQWLLVDPEQQPNAPPGSIDPIKPACSPHAGFSFLRGLESECDQTAELIGEFNPLERNA